MRAYEALPTTGRYANDESIAATSHWHYMALRRSGMAADDAAARALSLIHPGMRALDGGAYLELCLFYKGLTPQPPIDANATELELATLGYGVANWYWYEGRHDDAVKLWERVVNTSYWAAFGLIASEAELFRLGRLHGLRTHTQRRRARAPLRRGFEALVQ